MIAPDQTVSTHEVPLFPLHCVLFPGGFLPLRIFEPRYVDMVGRCLKADRPFGVVAIEDGSEVGEAKTFATGTLAEIVNWFRHQDGLLGIEAIGRDRFDIESLRRQDDGLYLGSVKPRCAERRTKLPGELAFAADLLRVLLPATGDADRGAPKDFDDAGWVGYRLAEALPLTLAARQDLLQIEDPIVRIERLASVVARMRLRPQP